MEVNKNNLYTIYGINRAYYIFSEAKGNLAELFFLCEKWNYTMSAFLV